MSSYWAANYGTGLVLNNKEFNAFVETYLEKTNQPDTDIEEFIEGIVYDSEPLIRSVHLENYDRNNSKHTFDVVQVSTDNCDGTYMTPYFVEKDGQLVKNKQGTIENGEFKINREYVAHSLRFEDVYIVFSDRSLFSPDVFTEKAYASYDALVQEFKDKLSAYLPEDFDWNGHIGQVDYASYA